MRWMPSWKPMENKPVMKKTLRALGLCAKARALVCGTPMVCEALRGKKKPLLVLCASDNSENTDKRLSDKCTYYEVEKTVLEAGGEELAAAIGKKSRVAAVAVTDENLCRLVEKAIREDRSRASAVSGT